MTASQNDVTVWIERLSAAARQADTSPIPPGLAPWFQVWCRCLPVQSTPPAAHPDERLWQFLSNPDSVEGVLPSLDTDSEALFGGPERFGSIELWTECELSGLHALSHLARGSDNPDLSGLLDRVALRHILDMQPDNATNRPWAIHAFLGIWFRRGCDEARLFAETQLHNAFTNLGRPDPLSGLILADSAESLKTAHGIAADAETPDS